MAEIEFRTGKREVPDYMADLMAGLQTHRMTYDEAVQAMNRKMLTDQIDRSIDRIVQQHFVENQG